VSSCKCGAVVDFGMVCKKNELKLQKVFDVIGVAIIIVGLLGILNVGMGFITNSMREKMTGLIMLCAALLWLGIVKIYRMLGL
jgi:hypothetical protein